MSITALLSNPLTVSVTCGVIGALTRVAVQIYRDGKMPESTPRTISLLFLGAVGGGISGLMDGTELAALALGYGASDVIENLLSSMYPKTQSE